MEDFLDVLFMIHEWITDFLASIIFTIPVIIEWIIWSYKFCLDPKNEKKYERYIKDKKYRAKVANYFVKKCSKVYRLKRRFQVYCCPIHVEW